MSNKNTLRYDFPYSSILFKKKKKKEKKTTTDGIKPIVCGQLYYMPTLQTSAGALTGW